MTGPPAAPDTIRAPDGATLRGPGGAATPAPDGATTPAPDGAQDLRCDAARNRERIIEAARDVFAQRGVGLTVDEVARRAGVGVGTVYRRFGSKDGLLDAVALPVFEQTLQIAERARREGDAEGFEWFMRRVVALYAGYGLPVRRLWGTAAGRSMRDRINPAVIRLIDGARAAGTLRADFRIEDVPVLVWTVTGLIEDTGRTPAVWRRHLDLILDGLRPGDPRPLSAEPVPLERWRRFAGGD